MECKHNQSAFIRQQQNRLHNIHYIILGIHKSGDGWKTTKGYASGNTFGIPLTYENWSNGEPDNAKGGQICAIMDTIFTTWEDVECDFKAPCICQFTPGTLWS